MAELEATLKKDFMVKRSLMKNRLLKTENYKSRWFILSPSGLRYCDGNLQDGSGKVKGEIPLRSITVVEEVPLDALGKPNVFQVSYLNKDDESMTLYIQAVHDEQRTQWVQSLKDACIEAVSPLEPTYHPGIWRNGSFSCCDSINKSCNGCQQATPAAAPSSSPLPKSNVVQLPETSGKGEKLQPPARQSPAVVKKPAVAKPMVLPKTVAEPPNAGPVPKPRKPAATPKKVVLALYSFEAVQPDDLSLVKGEEYELLQDDNMSWLKVKSKNGQEGFVPSNYVQLLEKNSTKSGTQLEQYEWYYKDATITSAEELLKNDGREGCFLVRDSRKAGMYSLSLFTKTLSKEEEGVVKHYHIKKTKDGKYFITESYAFSTLPELVVFHKQEPHGLAAKLKSPPGERLRQSTLTPAGLGHETKEVLLNELTTLEELGAGQFAQVVRGKYKGSIDVAIKMLKARTISEKDFVAEASTMTKLKHKNLVQLYGVCKQAKPLYIVTEYMKYGALSTYLRRNRPRLSDQVTKMTDMSIQVCSAMVYLESKSFVHRDLAARNCLVGENNIVKVADFGFSRFLVDDGYTATSGVKFPIRWCAPEVLLQRSYSLKSDVWSFGILLWEIFSCGDTPYQSFASNQVKDAICQRNTRLSQPPKCPDAIFNLMSSCWTRVPESRPSFSQLYTSLQAASDS